MFSPFNPNRMTKTITSTTDGRFVGHVLSFELTDREIVLGVAGSAVVVPVDRIISTPDGFMLIGSNYITTVG